MMPNLATRFLNFLVGQDSGEDLVYVPDHDSMQEIALNVYLKQYEKILISCDGLSHQLNIVQAAEKIFHIFNQLYTQHILSESRKNVWIANKLPLVNI